jgi:hypothetical protein
MQVVGRRYQMGGLQEERIEKSKKRTFYPLKNARKKTSPSWRVPHFIV